MCTIVCTILNNGTQRRAIYTNGCVPCVPCVPSTAHVREKQIIEVMKSERIVIEIDGLNFCARARTHKWYTWYTDLLKGFIGKVLACVPLLKNGT